MHKSLFVFFAVRATGKRSRGEFGPHNSIAVGTFSLNAFFECLFLFRKIQLYGHFLLATFLITVL
jgi:hypothetical protein